MLRGLKGDIPGID